MKRAFILPLVAFFCGGVSADASGEGQPFLQSYSLRMHPDRPAFYLQEGIKVHYSVSRSELGRAAIRALMAAGFNMLPEENTGALTVELVPNENTEWYAIQVSSQNINIQVASPQALTDAAKTLAQSVRKDADGRPFLVPMEVIVAP